MHFRNRTARKSAVERLGAGPAEEPGSPRSQGRTLVSLVTGTAYENPPIPTFDSPRLLRITRSLASQENLLCAMRRELDRESAAIAHLLVRQEDSMQQTFAELKERLQPVQDYADAEEANLAVLESRLDGDEMSFIARSFAGEAATQRERVERVRAHITDQRTPLLRIAESEATAIDVALSRFDREVAALERNLVEQRDLTLQLLDAMRSDAFVLEKQLLDARQALLESLARAAVIDPDEIALQLAKLHDEPRADQGGETSVPVGEVMEATEFANRSLASADANGHALTGA